jgi:hypothetical protein
VPVTFRLLFTPDISSAELQRFARRLGDWMAQRSESGSDHHATRDLTAGLSSADDETPPVPESFSVGPGLFDPERSLEIVLHPALFFDLREAEQSLMELIEEFPLVSWERADED